MDEAELLATQIGGTALVALPALILLIRCELVLHRARLAINGAPKGLAADWSQLQARSGRLATRATWLVVIATVAAIGIALLVTVLIEPDALMAFLGFGLYNLALPCIIALAFVLAAVHQACKVRELFDAISHSGLPADHPARVAALDQLGRVTWSQTGIAGLGIFGGVVCFVFGAGLIAALFALASTAISCARDPKCI